MNNSKVLCGLFPGQGSQVIGMAKAWHDSSEQAKKLFSLADEVLGFSLSKLCFEGPIEELTLTQNAQPALLLSSYISFILSEIEIQVAGGHSLGEYSALVAAGIIKLEDALTLVHKRGLYMQEAVPLGKGAMSAVMGPSEEEILNYIKDGAEGIVEVANLNSPGQIVLAGEAAAMAKFGEFLATKGAKVIPLKVSAPFHSSLMKPAADALAKDLDSTTFSEGKFTVYSNVTAQKINSPEEARELLKKQVCGTVRWTNEINAIINENNVTHSIEFGPGGVLSKLLKRTIPEVIRHEVYDPTSAEKAKDAVLSLNQL